MKKTILLILIKLFLFTTFVNANSLETPIINLNPEIIKNEYELNDIYKEPPELPNKNTKKEDSSLNLDANVNKEKKEIDSLKIDVGKKF